MSKFEVLSLIISILAAIISTISLVRTRELAKEQLELEKVTAELSRLQIESITEQKTEKTKPKFNVSLTKLGKAYNFYISNTGQGSGYNVNFELIDCEDSPLFTSELMEIFPYQEMKPSSRIKLLASLHMNSPSKYQSRISWEDESGKKHDEIFWTSL
ncbi:hypothetical protein [Psychrobacter sp. SWN149]|uniref:hypothetical protein n=1 Tax=Psychrobacter sp. SWN149 TaxID=2792057 RepID=UPI0018CF6925|nr:hypothetical protein [Psychrobacter sp. SWN149]MBH0006210.1 hypothetical protein [Psychrobacter sp. SWN149]